MKISKSIRTPRRHSLYVATLALGVAGTFGQAGAQAGTQGEVLTTVVRFAPGDLQTAHGARELYRRLTIAAKQVCPPQALSGTVFSGVDAKRCREHAVRRAVLQIQNPRLTDVMVARLPALVRERSKLGESASAAPMAGSGG